jgi:hypothetical protein
MVVHVALKAFLPKWICIRSDRTGHDMTNKERHKPSLGRPSTYQIMVPGHIGEGWTDWVEGLTITVDDDGGWPVTTLTGTVDQAALQGLLRRLYSLGLPLISVVCVASDAESRSESNT